MSWVSLKFKNYVLLCQIYTVDMHFFMCNDFNELSIKNLEQK